MPSPRTVVEALVPLSGAASAREVYDAANLVGIADQPMRLTLRRMIAGEELVQDGRGRSALLSLTPAGRERILFDRRALSLAFAQDAGAAPWDGRWHLFALTVPEEQRIVRDTLRRTLTHLGAVTVATSLYVSAHDLGEAFPPATRRFVATAASTDLNLRGVTDPRAIAETLWPAEPLVEGYRAVGDALRDDDQSAPVVARRLRLADALERAMRDDPLLPPELRASDWAPASWRHAWAQRWESLGDDARVYPGWHP
ncbi:PaaX family transcriptional regulator [Microbacterium sp. BWR-S6Y]|uniref:PaaX family transcriptional regulator n=1 Tax=Microbacterium sp. BWR-S6Y TaxID=3232073 RepID=UPI0035271665